MLKWFISDLNNTSAYFFNNIDSDNKLNNIVNFIDTKKINTRNITYNQINTFLDNFNKSLITALLDPPGRRGRR